MKPVGPQSKTVLVVDDDPLVLELVSGVLRGAGHAVTKADHPAQALKLVHAMNQIDVLISDIQMPGMPGTDLAKEVARRYPAVRILMMSGSHDHKTAHALLSKPFTAPALIAAFDSLWS